MGKTKTEMRPLMCRLSEDELEQQGKALTDLLQEKAELEIQKSASARHYSDAIKAVDVKIEKQIPIVRDREIEREVEVRTEYNVPDTGKKRKTRLDTLEIIFEGQMTDAECQDLFINAEPAEEVAAEDEAIDVPAVKLLPAAADDREPIIHVEKPELGERCHIDLEVGKLYEIGGIVCRCVRETAQCYGCLLQDKEVLCYYNFTCDGVVLKAGVVRPDKEEQNETEATDTPEDKPSEEETTEVRHPVVCEKCGSQQNVYHVDREKPLCGRCLEHKNQKNLAKVEAALAEKKRILVRHLFGYGCRIKVADCTCFRFIIYDNDKKKLYASWGAPVYLPGDYRTEGTDAADYYKKLLAQGVEEG